MTTWTHSATATIGRRDGSKPEITHPVEALTIRQDIESTPTIEADILFTGLDLGGTWVAPETNTLSWINLVIQSTSSDGKRGSRGILLWIMDVEIRQTMTKHETIIRAGSLDWVLQRIALPETKPDSTTGTSINTWWNTNFGPTGTQIQSFVKAEFDSGPTAPDAPQNPPIVSLSRGTTLWDVASTVARAYDRYVTGNNSKTAPAWRGQTFVNYNAELLDYRLKNGNVVEISTRTHGDNYGGSYEFIYNQETIDPATGEVERKETRFEARTSGADLSPVKRIEVYSDPLREKAELRRTAWRLRGRYIELSLETTFSLWTFLGGLVDTDTGRYYITGFTWQLGKATMRVSLSKYLNNYYIELATKYAGKTYADLQAAWTGYNYADFNRSPLSRG